jgi:glycosyltransferase involved in cell wall biosynthesis
MISIEVGICALNEEHNIKKILRDVSNQKSDIFKIKRILLISDGSQDKTTTYAKSLKLKNLKIIEHRERKGKSQRLTELFKMASADWLVLIDADIFLKNAYTMHNLILSGEKSGSTLVGGNPKKINTNSFTDRAMNVSAFLQEYVKEHIKNGDNVFSCHGRIMAIRSNHIKNMALPIMIQGNDAYIYFANLMSGGKFSFANNSIVLYKMPQTFCDFAKQERRFGNTINQQYKIFGEIALEEFRISKAIKFKSLFSALLKHGGWVFVYISYKILAKFYSPRKLELSSGMWDMAESTKRLE